MLFGNFPIESCRKAFKVLLNAFVKAIDHIDQKLRYISKEKNDMLATLVLGFALNPGDVLIWLLVGLIAGAVAGFLMRGSGYGIVGDIIVGCEFHSWFWIVRPTHSGGFQTLRLQSNLPSKPWALEGAAYVP